ncbi:MAG TPA: type III-A CRISPR-associated protein Csm2 [Campylobacterales bacterium]|jgi:CRISPR-associated protein Csm2|nr:type III-A CRISPR-associated protein Csm2 [Campylobacterales bacterium]
MKNFDPDFKNTKKLANLFGEEAKRVANLLNDGGFRPDISTTQFRQFYEKILELNDKAQGLNKEEFDVKILPFVKLLNSKVQYSFSRRNCKENFVDMMKKSIDKVESGIELQNFKYFLEAIIGYMPKK